MGTWRAAVGTGGGGGVGVSRGAVEDPVGSGSISGGLGRSRKISVGPQGMLLGLREGPWALRGLWKGILWDSMGGGLAGSALGGGFPGGEVCLGMGGGSLDIGAHSPLLGAQGV